LYKKTSYLHYLKKFIELARLHNRQKETFWGLTEIYRFQEHHEAAESLREALLIAYSPQTKIYAHLRLSEVLLLLYQTTEALEAITNAQNEFHQTLEQSAIDQRERIYSDILLAHLAVYLQQNIEDKILHFCDIINTFLEENKEAFSKQEIARIRTKILFSQARACNGNQEPLKVAQLYQNAVEEAHHLSPKDDFFARLHYNAATHFCDAGKPEEALKHANVLRSIPIERHNQWLEYYLPTLQAEMCAAEGNIEQAISLYQEGITIANRVAPHALYFLAEVYCAISKVYENMNLHAEALQAFKNYHQYTQKLGVQEQKELHTQIESQRQSLDLRLETQRLQFEKAKVEAERDRQDIELQKYATQKIQLERIRQLVGTIQQSLSDEDTQAIINQKDTTLHTTFNELTEQLVSIENTFESSTMEEYERSVPLAFQVRLNAVRKDHLTPLEMKVLLLIRAGIPTKKMPAILFRSEGYIKQLRMSAKAKLTIPKGTTLNTFIQTL
jgi:DNA-binding CsgD family transcriptional regulator